MSVSKKYFIFKFCFIFWGFISFQNVSGIQIELTRIQAGDYFSNPYDDTKFCLLTNSMCYKQVPEKDDVCSSCKCPVHNTTFNFTSLGCVPNKDSLNRGECTLNFGGNYKYVSNLYLLAFDLTKSGKIEIEIPQLPSGASHKLQSCAVNEVAQMSSNGYEIVSSQTFGIDSINWKLKTFSLTWSTPNEDQQILGRVFRITFRCKHKKPGPKKVREIVDCIMLKSEGTVQIYHPGLPKTTPSSVLVTSAATAKTTITTSSSLSASPSPIPLPSPSLSPTPSPTPSPSLTTQSLSPTTTSSSIVLSSSPLPEIFPSSTAKEFIKQSSTFYANLVSSTQRTTSLPSSVKQEEVKASATKFTPSTVYKGNPEETMAPSSSSVDTELPSGPNKEKRSSEDDGNVVVYVIVVVVIVVIAIVLAVVVRLTMKRKKKKMMRKRESQAHIMSDINKNNINEDDEDTYTALDETMVGKDESNYEALTLPEERKGRSIADAYNKKMQQKDDEYIYVDADRVYSTIDPQINDEKLGAKNNDAFDANEKERVYSILEQKPGQIDYATQSINDDSERVYSILETEAGQIAYGGSSNPGDKPANQGCLEVYSTLDEEQDENASCDYVTVLPPKLEPGQSDSSIYAELSEQRAAENQYQSLVKRKK